jgi:hypothetical protein
MYSKSCSVTLALPEQPSVAEAVPNAQANLQLAAHRTRAARGDRSFADQNEGDRQVCLSVYFF